MDLFEGGAIQNLASAMSHRLPSRVGDTKKNGSETDQVSQLKEAAKAFEAYFVHSLLKELRKTGFQGEILGGGMGQEIYQSIFDERIAQKMTESGGIGLANLILRNLSTELKISEESTDRGKAIGLYHRLLDNVTEGVKGVKDEDTRK